MEGKKVEIRILDFEATSKYILSKISSLLPRINVFKEQHYHASLLNALGSQNKTSSHYVLPIRQTNWRDGTTIRQSKSWLKMEVLR